MVRILKSVSVISHLLTQSIFLSAGGVTIKGACVNCNRPDQYRTTARVPTTRRGYGGRSYSHGSQTTARPRQSYRQPARADDWSMDGWNFHQTADGTQQISGGRGYRW